MDSIDVRTHGDHVYITWRGIEIVLDHNSNLVALSPVRAAYLEFSVTELQGTIEQTTRAVFFVPPQTEQDDPSVPDTEVS